MYCIIHSKGAGHTTKMCPKVKKGIEEAQEENRAPSQSKIVNHVRQEQQSSQQTYYPMHYGHAQALLPGPPPAYNYESLTMYHPIQNQWRQNKSQQSSVQSTQPEASIANNSPQNSQVKPSKRTILHQFQR